MPIGYNSSVRACAIDETLRHARAIGANVGVTRVTDTTRLDRAGVPVFAAIRPGAQVGSLCVNAGKGLTVAEAQVGAYMEAVEFAFAEPARAQLAIRSATGREIAAGGYRLADFGPRSDVALDETRPIHCVEADDLVNGRRCLVPAERVLLPYPHSFFTCDSNGLASGNTLLEATVHALSEVIERDILAFAHLRPWRRVRNDSLPGGLAEIAARVASVGLELIVRVSDNEYELPFFQALVREPNLVDAVHQGFGCHPWRAIAATRAVCEAFQDRLTVIHGGRDSLLRLHERDLKTPQPGARDRYAEEIARAAETVDFAAVLDYSATLTTLEALYAELEKRAVAVSGGVLRVQLTPPDFPLQVVKVIAPRMELYHADRLHAGARLRAAQDAARRKSAVKSAFD